MCRVCARPAGKGNELEIRMSMTDPIADFLTRIRNGQRAGKAEVGGDIHALLPA